VIIHTHTHTNTPVPKTFPTSMSIPSSCPGPTPQHNPCIPSFPHTQQILVALHYKHFQNPAASHNPNTTTLAQASFISCPQDYFSTDVSSPTPFRLFSTQHQIFPVKIRIKSCHSSFFFHYLPVSFSIKAPAF
jgi:hypothetical protein